MFIDILWLFSTAQVHPQKFLLMENPCDDCAYTTCARLHSYVAHGCKLSDGNPCQECVQLEKLDSQISKVHSKLVRLAQKRRAYKAKINQRHEPFIHRLPLRFLHRFSQTMFTRSMIPSTQRKHPIRHIQVTGRQLCSSPRFARRGEKLPWLLPKYGGS